MRWWTVGGVNRLLLVTSVVGLIGVGFDARFGFLVALAQLGPLGLTLRGRTSSLAWTDRLRRLAFLTGLASATIYVIGGLIGSPLLIVAGLFALPPLIDLLLLVVAPLEKRLGRRWVDKASAKLKSSAAKVVAITGSYGKTSTKIYLSHLISGSLRTVASPASFNNRMGLARAINEHLVPGTEVFIAEMGTYGRGEIAELCEWIRPTIGAIVSIGPVHLERFRTEERIVAAKSEILDRASTGVIAVDHPLLSRLAAEREGRLELVTVSADGGEADVVFRPEDRMIVVEGQVIGSVPEEVFPLNLAVAVAIAKSLGVEVDTGRFLDLPSAQHRQTVSVSENGVTIIDNTFNSNPAGARAALKLLGSVAARGRKVLVTPGMVELGPIQDRENQDLASTAATVCDDLVLVGATNRAALLRGSNNGPASVTVVANREQAVAWVRAHLREGDAVLYENDLPDHYP
jgi:UDP-N-acetylmuramoyl-tripeptide--D-alanyl-D-alanine ligase